MKLKKKILCIFMIALVLLPSAAFANTENETVDTVENPVILDFRYYSSTLDSVSADEVDVVKTIDNQNAMEYKLYDKETQLLIETVRVDFSTEDSTGYSTRANGTRSTFFTRTKSYGSALTVEYRVRVDLYESGSFRSFYDADSPNLLVKSSITPIELVNSVPSVKSTTNSYPTTSLTYSFSANARTTETITTSVGAVLSGASFSKSTGTNVYYYRIVSDTGEINLY